MKQHFEFPLNEKWLLKEISKDNDDDDDVSHFKTRTSTTSPLFLGC